MRAFKDRRMLAVSDKKAADGDDDEATHEKDFRNVVVGHQPFYDRVLHRETCVTDADKGDTCKRPRISISGTHLISLAFSECNERQESAPPRAWPIGFITDVQLDGPSREIE
jgi:hypothetical protein